MDIVFFHCKPENARMKEVVVRTFDDKFGVVLT